MMRLKQWASAALAAVMILSAPVEVCAGLSGFAQYRDNVESDLWPVSVPYSLLPDEELLQTDSEADPEDGSSQYSRIGTPSSADNSGRGSSATGSGTAPSGSRPGKTVSTASPSTAVPAASPSTAIPEAGPSTAVPVASPSIATPSTPSPDLSLSDEEILNRVFRNSYEVFDQYRHDTGVYKDSILLYDGIPFHPSSIAASGIGFMSLAIADKKGWDSEALEKARLTAKTMAGHTDGFMPDVSSNGFIRHFINLDTGEREWNCEYSTIDTAIFITGALFAKKYFNDPELSSYVDELYQQVDFQDAIADPDTGGIYMIINSDGSGNENAITLPYNEYIIVAWLAYNQHINEPGSRAVKMWNKWYATPDNLLTKDYQGIPLLTDDEDHYLASFTLLFPYYMVNMFSTSSKYKQYVKNAYLADQLWAANTGIMESYEWGNGAGNSKESGGYHADSINNNDEMIISPHIISGFLPINPSGKDDLVNLYRNDKGVYQLPLSGDEILWRYSALNTSWESDSIQAIDYSTFLFGLAANDSEIGMEFFRKYNNFFESHNSNSSNGSSSSGGSDKGSSAVKSFGTWKQDAIGWWYQNADGSYPKSEWKKINEKWYWFDPSGYIATGWKSVEGKWYYLNENGAMAASDWVLYNGKWYFLNADGSMATGWIEWKNEWYYLEKNLETYGIMAADQWIHGGAAPYFVDSTGKWMRNAVFQ